jgi:hypothetical protein
MAIDSNPHPQNANLPRHDNLQSDENIIDLSESHPVKQHSQRSVTEPGISIDVPPLSPNAHFSTFNNLEPAANVTDVSDLDS